MPRVVKHSLSSRVMRRLWVALAVFFIAVGLLILWLVQTTGSEAQRRDIETVATYYRQRIGNTLDELGDQALRLRSRLEFGRLFTDPGTDWRRLKGYITTQNLLDVYERILVTDAADAPLFAAGSEELPGFVGHREGVAEDWYYQPVQQRLFRVYFQPVLLGQGRPGHLVLFRAIDHGLLNSLTYPDTDLFVVYRGQIVASSLGEVGHQTPLGTDGIRESAGVFFAQHTQPFPYGDADAPSLVVQRHSHRLLGSGWLLVILAATLALLGLALWLTIGRWLIHVGRRIEALENATEAYASIPSASAGFLAALTQADERQADEISRVAASLQKLVETIAIRETQRDAAEQTLRDSEARVREITNTIADGIYVVDNEGRISFLNPEAERMLGWRQEELLGRESHAAFHYLRPDGSAYPVADCPIHQSIASGFRTHLLQDWMVRRDGSLLPVAVSASPLMAGGEARGAVVAFTDISERLRAETEYRSILATAMDGFWIADTSARLIEVNDAYCRMSGYSREELLAMRIPDLEAVEDADATRRRMEKLLAEGSDRFETRHRRKDGSLILLEISTQYLPMRGGVFVVFLRDITAQRRTEEHFRVLFNGSNDAIFVHRFGPDVRGERFLEVNAEACARLGYSRDELLLLTPQDIDAPDVVTDQAIIDQLDRSGRALFESVHIAKDGRHIPVEINAQRLEIDGQPILLAVARDITERKAAERKVNDLLDLNRKIVSESTLGIAAYGADGRCVMANQSMAEIVGGTVPMLERQNFHDIASWRQSGLHDAAEQALATGVPQRRQVQLATSFGRQVWLDCDCVSFESSGERHLLFIANDITQFRLAEQVLRDAKRAADEASRAKSEFLANMSHEIRTPLNAIIGLTHLALESKPDQRQHDYLAKIELSSRSLLGIINDLLDFSKIEAGKLELERVEFTLDDVLRNAANQFVPVAESKGIEIVISMSPDVPPRLIGDPLRLTQIINNLLGNAVKFTEHGEIRLAATRLGEDQGNATLRFAISDTGIGLKADQVERLFNPFTQADGSITRRFGGTGLGLTISKQLVEQMGGRIGVESVYGQGSEFWFTVRLPVAEDGHLVPPALNGRRALVADDLESSRRILKAILTTWGMDVVTAADGTEALTAIHDAGPFDLVVLDWKMPNMDGIDAARAMTDWYAAQSAQGRPPVIIMVTAFSRDEALAAARDVSIDAVLNKPVTPSGLMDAIVESQGKELADAISRPVKPPDWRELAAPLHGTHILVVEDNEINQQVAREILEHAGIGVTVAENGEIALDLLDRQAFDAVLMDIHMPVLDGIEATRRLRRDPRFRKLPVLAMTAAAMTQDRTACLAAGMNDHVAKPINPEQLFVKLAQWVKGHGLRRVDLHGSEATPPLPTLPGFALGEFLDRLGGNRALLVDLLHQFAADFATSATELRQLTDAGNFAAAHELTHRIKGVAGNISATELYRQATVVDGALRTGHRPETLDDFIATLEHALADIAGMPEQDTGASAPADPEATAKARTALASLRTTIVARGFISADQRSKLDALRGYPVLGERIQHLCHALEQFDFATAESIVDQLLSDLPA